jgi:hypothetical protein
LPERANEINPHVVTGLTQATSTREISRKKPWMSRERILPSMLSRPKHTSNRKQEAIRHEIKKNCIDM